MNATQRLINECRDLCLELQIQTAGQQMKIATLLLLEHGCDYFSLAGERDFWRMQMETLITKRSPTQLARMGAK